MNRSKSAADGGLKNALVYLKTDNVDVAPEYEKTAKDDVVLDNKTCRFEPHVSILRVGQPLVIKNSDTVGHNTKAEAFKNTSFNDIIPAGSEIKKTWDQAETLPVKIGCSIHTWMGGYILVRSDPYAAVTNADGKFTIKDLPAGKELDFQLWQEKSGYLKEAKNKDVKVDKKGRFKLKLKPGENDLGDIVVSPSIFKKAQRTTASCKGRGSPAGRNRFRCAVSPRPAVGLAGSIVDRLQPAR